MKGLLTALLLVAMSQFAASQEKAVFAFGNQTGTHLLALNPDSQSPTVTYSPERLSKALCMGNHLLDIVFDRHQASGPQDNGRQTSANFEQLRGEVFRIVNGKVNKDDVCLLIEATYASQHRLLPFAASAQSSGGADLQQPPCSAKLIADLAHQYELKVKRCSVLARVADVHFVVAEFDPHGTNLFAVEALATEDMVRSHAEPAHCVDAQGSRTGWRVDDDCRFDPASLAPLFAWKRSDGEIEIGVEWAGAEGGDLMLFRTSGKDLLKVANSYRYWAPL